MSPAPSDNSGTYSSCSMKSSSIKPGYETEWNCQIGREGMFTIGWNEMEGME